MHAPNEKKPVPPPATEVPDPAVYTVTEFCETHRISRSKLYDLFDDGSGPAVIRVGRRLLISGKAAQDWRKSREQPPSGSGGKP